MIKAIVGANWGDEGKGKITDMLAAEADIVIRFQGGSNAGHTIINDYGKFALHQMPSGIFNENTVNIIGTGVAFNIPYFVKELNYIKINKNLKDKFLIGYMYNKYMKSENKEEIIKEMYNLSLIFPREYLCTVYLIAISKKHSLFLKADSIYDDILKELNVK